MRLNVAETEFTFLHKCLTNRTFSVPVFLQKLEADSVLWRRRANSGFLEEEVFENDDKTTFLEPPVGRDPCLVNPCQNNGTCVYVGTSYECQCSEGFEGRYCQTVFEDSLKCLYQNGLCDQFCDGSGERRRCSCSEGYQLAEDGWSCVAQEEPGLNQTDAVQTRVVGGNHCPPGECPWQVLVQLNGNSHCGGVLVRPDWVITAAHCIHGNSPDNLTVVAGNEEFSGTGDLLLRVVLKCSAQVLLRHSEVVVELYSRVPGLGLGLGWGQRTGAGPTSAASSPVLRRMTVPLIQNSQCSQRAQFNLTGTMLCAGYLQGRQESCRGDDGSPLVTLFGSTHFLTGPGYYGLYANMAALVDWVQEMTSNSLDYCI
uniref:Coagulation factor VIIi n=1 Tax=Amphiprion percula TaxID=161767 RepID=A0A3P8SLY7_AMPPE